MTETPEQPTALSGLVIGWREMISLPELGIESLPAKIDTGARTSALHAVCIEPFEEDGEPWARFRVDNEDGPQCSAPVVDERPIKNTSGIAETRHIIKTLIVLGGRRWRIEISLADRTAMTWPLILGRTAVRRRRLLINAGRSFLLGPPHMKTPPD